MKGIPAVVLAGGQATRMGGGDKCLLDLGGQRLLDVILERLTPQAGAIALNVNGDPDRFEHAGVAIIADTIPGFAGPLAGVLAGMDWAAGLGAEHVATVAGDTPFFPRGLVPRLQGAAAKTGAPVALAATRDPEKGIMRHPTFGLWAVELRHDLRRALAAGLRKVVLWTDKHGAETAIFDDTRPDPFFNVNNATDLELARQIFRQQRNERT